MRINNNLPLFLLLVGDEGAADLAFDLESAPGRWTGASEVLPICRRRLRTFFFDTG